MAATRQYVALLRGINVGGNNPIKMTALKACFEKHGFDDVATYIQSGNVLFRTDAADPIALTATIEKLLSATFRYTATVVVRSYQQMRAVVERAPDGFASGKAKYRSDVVFLKEPLTARAAMKHVRTREGVDEAYAGPGVLYFQRLAAQATRSLFSRIVLAPIYPSITIRNWNTTTRLLALMSARHP